MTLSGRNRVVRSLIVFSLGLNATIAALYLRIDDLVPIPRALQLVAAIDTAVVGAVAATICGIVTTIIFTRVFRRTPSGSVFFIMVGCLAMTLDGFKVLQAVLERLAYSQFSVLVSRATTFGHLVGAFALFAAGLYAGGLQMQRHALALVLGAVGAVALVGLVPIDASTLPANLVYRAGGRISVSTIATIIGALGILNYMQGAIAQGDSRVGFSTLCVGGMLVARELLYYLDEMTWIALGLLVFVVSCVGYAIANYRDSILG